MARRYDVNNDPIQAGLQGLRQGLSELGNARRADIEALLRQKQIDLADKQEKRQQAELDMKNAPIEIDETVLASVPPDIAATMRQGMSDKFTKAAAALPEDTAFDPTVLDRESSLYPRANFDRIGDLLKLRKESKESQKYKPAKELADFMGKPLRPGLSEDSLYDPSDFAKLYGDQDKDKKNRMTAKQFYNGVLGVAVPKEIPPDFEIVVPDAALVPEKKGDRELRPEILKYGEEVEAGLRPATAVPNVGRLSISESDYVRNVIGRENAKATRTGQAEREAEARRFQEEQQRRQQAFQAKENKLGRGLRAGEGDAARRFQAEQQKRQQDFQARENKLGRGLRVGEGDQSRKFQADQQKRQQIFQARENALGRGATAEANRLTRELKVIDQDLAERKFEFEQNKPGAKEYTVDASVYFGGAENVPDGMSPTDQIPIGKQTLKAAADKKTAFSPEEKAFFQKNLGISPDTPEGAKMVRAWVMAQQRDRVIGNQEAKAIIDKLEAEQRRADRKEEKVEKQTEKMSKRVEASAVVQAAEPMRLLKSEIGNFSDPNAKLNTKKVPGSGTTAALAIPFVGGIVGREVARGYGGEKVLQSITAVENSLLKLKSGTAVTTGEEARQKLERGMRAGGTEQDVIEGLRLADQAFALEDAAIRGGYSPEAKNLFQDQGGVPSYQELTGGSVRPAAPEPSKGAPQSGYIRMRNKKTGEVLDVSSKDYRDAAREGWEKVGNGK